MRRALALLIVLLAAGGIALVLALGKRGRRSAASLWGVTRLLFVTTQLCALVWVFISHAIAIYSTARLQQVQTLAELSEPAICTILGVSALKVLENIFEHNDGKIFGQSKHENPPEVGGEEDTYYDEGGTAQRHAEQDGHCGMNRDSFAGAARCGRPSPG